MKTIGDKAQEFRLAKGWNTTRMAKEVGTSRQNIESLESKGDRKPRYIIELARVMGVTVDELMDAESPAHRKQTHTAGHPGAELPSKGNIADLAARRSTDTAENALRVLADIIRPMSAADRATIANNLRSFGLDPDGPVALSSLLAGLDAANARRRYEPPPQSTALGGG